MMIPFPLAALYLAILPAIGYLVATRLLHLRSAYEIIALSSTVGIACAMVLGNALSLVLPFHVATLLTFILLLIICIIIMLCTPPSPAVYPESSRRAAGEGSGEGWVLWFLIGLALVVAFANARFAGSDPWAWIYYPIAATIREGNFPVRQPTGPLFPVGYHYGPALLAAQFSELTGLSLAVGYGIQNLFGAFGILFACAALIRRFLTPAPRAILLGSILAFGGSGFVWVRGVWLLRDLVRHFLLGAADANPFRWLAAMFGTNIGPSLLLYFGSRTYTVGIPLLFVTLFLLALLFSKNNRPSSPVGACHGMPLQAGLSLIFLLALGLTIETSLVLLLPATALFAGIVGAYRHTPLPGRNEENLNWKHIAFVGGGLIVSALLIAFVQGGILTAALHNHDLQPASFGFGGGRLGYHSSGATVGIFEWFFIRDMGFPFFLFPVASLYIWKTRAKRPLGLFFLLLALVQFSTPFLIHYLPRVHELLRTVYVGISLSSLLIGVMLSETLLASRRALVRIGGLCIVGSMLLASALYLVTRLIIPTMRFERAPLFPSMPAISSEQAALYDWVHSSTTINDIFYIRTLLDQDSVPELEQLQKDRILFMTYTGRFNVGFINFGTFTPEQRLAEHRIENTCSLEAFRELNVRYLMVETAQRADWFQMHCKPGDWMLRYDGATTGRAYPRVYETGLFVGL